MYIFSVWLKKQQKTCSVLGCFFIFSEMKNVCDFKEKCKREGTQVSLPDVLWFNDLVSKGVFSPETLLDEIPPKYF